MYSANQISTVEDQDRLDHPLTIYLYMLQLRLKMSTELNNFADFTYLCNASWILLHLDRARVAVSTFLPFYAKLR